ncbi:MAG: hypothetical protein A2W00_13965 [Candidatus Eisenbacteria bacterium RBG_16_71_46]|nr:MAG: hypothetical protein A2W00_13965 [Candidatus Eisenbacteria bacterium RBG_16_71_46]
MDGETGSRVTKSMVWGTFLIALGALMLLERLGVLAVPPATRLWPAILIALGVARFAEGRVGAGLTWMLAGGWLLACGFGWLGLTFGNSWPLLLVALGVGIVVRALRHERCRCACCAEASHV